MPYKNVVRNYCNNAYYHIYSRGSNKQDIFIETQDYEFFLSLFDRYLSPANLNNSTTAGYRKYEDLSLISYCLMTNHFHLLIYQEESTTISHFMKSILTSYCMYFNKKYKRSGPLFQSSFKAKLIDKNNYLDHISRYIHLNPRNWRDYPYSSLSYILGEKKTDWINPKPLLELFSDNSDIYIDFLEDYSNYDKDTENT